MTEATDQTKPPGKASPSFLDKAEKIAKIFATAAIPIIIGVGGWIIQTTMEHDKEEAARIQQDQQRAVDKDKISLEYVKIAKEILTSTEKDIPRELTTWSWRLIDGVSPVKFAKDDLDRLIARKERIPTPTTARDFRSLADEYDRMFKNMTLTVGNQKVDGIVDKIVEFKGRYSELERKTGVPWFVVGVLHYEENGMNFQKHLHNNDPLTALTVHVPVGRPGTGQPPFTWEDSALDALELSGFTHTQDWSITRILFELERWNGFGYRVRQINSPFLWNCTSYYTTGRFVDDGVFDPGSMAERCGGAPLLKRLVDRQLIAIK
jgi:lysozyme family protein